MPGEAERSCRRRRVTYAALTLLICTAGLRAQVPGGPPGQGPGAALVEGLGAPSVPGPGAAPVQGHGTLPLEEHGAAPVRGPATTPVQDFIANRPGTYELHVIQPAGDGWVLERNRLPRRLSRYTHGAVTLLSFAYTYCIDPTGCPLAYAVFVDVRQRVMADPDLRGKVRFVSLSFDPANDTPPAMQQYGGEYAKAREPRWHFLTTWSMRFLEPILEAYGQDVEVERDPAGTPTRAITHLLKVFLIDPRAQVREIYSTAFLHPEVVFNDIKTLVLESERSAPRVSPPATPGASPSNADAFGLPPLQLPTGVVLNAEPIGLGRKLFFDRRLSSSGTMSCAMCHVPEEGFTSNASRRAVGMAGTTLRRNAPSLLNVAWQPVLFHDGRESSLTAQAWLPLLNGDEMANPSVEHVLARIRSIDDYAGRFERAFRGSGPTRETVGAALAAYESTLVSANSRFDRWLFGGEADALSDLEQQGFRVFSGKGQCSACHQIGDRHALLADGKFHVTGAGFEARERERFVVPLAPGVQTVLTVSDFAPFARLEARDPGRFDVTRDPADRYAFRTPTLRNVSRSAPYMHDGSLGTLEEVIEFYDRGAGDAPGKSPRLRALGLSAEEKRALIAFLRALDGANVDALASGARAREVLRP